jgi:hypothetical protein
MNGIGANLPITAKAAKMSDTMNTTVVGGDRFISSPSLFVDGRTVIVFAEIARGLLFSMRKANVRFAAVANAANKEAG